jgi:hypothetical protein
MKYYRDSTDSKSNTERKANFRIKQTSALNKYILDTEPTSTTKGNSAIKKLNTNVLKAAADELIN